MSELPQPPKWWLPQTEDVELDGLGYPGAVVTVCLNWMPAWIRAYFAADALMVKEPEAWKAARLGLGALVVRGAEIGGEAVTVEEMEEVDERLLTFALSEAFERRPLAYAKAKEVFRLQREKASQLRGGDEGEGEEGAAQDEEPAAEPADAPTAAAFKRRYGGGDSEAA